MLYGKLILIPRRTAFWELKDMEKMADYAVCQAGTIPRRTAFPATERYGENGRLPFC
jgi:hypothetical protein